MAGRKITELNAASAANLHDSALAHVVDTTEALAVNQNVKATIAQLRTAIINANAVGSSALADDAVIDTKLRNSAATSVIGRSANSAGNPADIAAGSDGQVLRRASGALGFGTVAEAGIANAAVTPAKTSFLPQLAAGGAVYLGIVNADATTVLLPSGWSVTSMGTGAYRVTHNFGVSTYVVVATPATSQGQALVYTRATNYFDITTSDSAGTGSNRNFHFILVRHA